MIREQQVDASKLLVPVEIILVTSGVDHRNSLSVSKVVFLK